MKYWTICYPGESQEIVYETLSEADIIQQYWPYWSSKMIDIYGEEEFKKQWSEKECIEDWVTIHWAWSS